MPTITAWVLLALQGVVLTIREVARRLGITPQRATAWLHYVLLSGYIQRTTREAAERTLRAWAITPAGQAYRPPEVYV